MSTTPPPPTSPAAEPAGRRFALPPRPDTSHLVTEDGAPVDSVFSDKQHRLLVDPLYAGWSPGGRSFVAMTDVGIFRALHVPPLAPDMLLSVGVSLPADLLAPENRSYFYWEYGKPPDVVVEVVSNREGGELDRKLREYVLFQVEHYLVCDPRQLLGPAVIRSFQLRGSQGYVERADTRIEEFGLMLVPWEGVYENQPGRWARWADLSGTLLPTGRERAEQAEREARRRTEQAEEAQRQADAAQRQAAEAQRQADEAQRRTLEAARRNERLRAQLRALGIEPEDS